MRLPPLRVVLVGSAGTLLAALALATPSLYETVVEQRIAHPAALCLQGEDCGVALVATSTGGAPRSGEAVYKVGCAVCHDAGVGGAPRLGTAGDWSTRLSKGTPALTASVRDGLGAMPPKGLCQDCSDEELLASVEYMLSSL